MGTNRATQAAEKGNEIAAASLAEQQRQYNEQQQQKKEKEARAKANAFSVRQGDVYAYGNNIAQDNTLAGNRPGGISLLNVGDTLGAGSDIFSSTLGG